MFPPTYLYFTTHHGNGTEGGMGYSDHDATPSHPVAQGVVEPTRSLLI